MRHTTVDDRVTFIDIERHLAVLKQAAALDRSEFAGPNTTCGAILFWTTRQR